MGKRNKTRRQSKQGKVRRSPFVASLIIALVGIGLSAELVHVHHQVHTSGAAQPSCNYGGQFSCSPVALHEWANVFGVPTAIWGLLTYLGFAALAIAGLRQRAFPHGPGGMMFWAAMPSALFGFFLAYIMAFEINYWCIYCVGLDGVNIGLLICSALSIRGRGTVSALIDDLRILYRNRPVGIAVLAGPVLAGVLVLLSYPRGGSGRPERNDKNDLLANLPRQGNVDMDAIAAGEAPFFGPEDAMLVIYEFSDYQCPFCRRAHEEVRKVIKRHRQKIRFIHFHHPLDMACNPQVKQPFHPVACFAAAAAICAQERNKFWELNDLLFSKNKSLDSELILALGTQVGIDADALHECIKSQKTQEVIAHELQVGTKIPVQGTPTFVVNNEIMSGYIPEMIFEAMVQKLISRNGHWW